MNNGSHGSGALRVLLLEEAETRAGEHPGLDALAEYQDGSLDGPAEERIRDHLVGCRRCADHLLVMGPLLRPEPAPADGVADLEVEGAWRRFQKLVGARDLPGSAGWRPRWNLAVAASLAVAAMALGLWALRLQHVNSTLRDQVARFSAPVDNLPLFYLEGTRRGAGGRDELFEVQVSAEYFALIFPLAEIAPAEQYELEFLTSDRKTVLRRSGLVASDSGGLRLGLSRGFLPAADYRILLRALEGSDWRQIEEYRVRIGYPESAQPPAGRGRG